MSSEPVIRVRNLGKSYRLYERPQDRIKQTLSFRLQQLGLRRASTYYREFWALRDISFDVSRGETVGIVGRNGSGKSTLLQLIAGILMPTSGELEVRGRVAALLELGTGFNPRYTGLENVFLYGRVLGMSKRQLDEALPEIVAFADIGEFLHQPLQVYSTGMVMRLAFAVSLAREPEILLVDEALAVGDEAFARKCLAKIESLTASGTTVLFVSHASSLVVETCDRALLLDEGELLCDGTAKRTVDLYTRLLFTPPAGRARMRDQIRRGMISDPQERADDEDGPMESFFAEDLVSKSRLEYEPRGAFITDPHVETPDGRRVNILAPFGIYRYCYEVRFTEEAKQVQFGMLIKKLSGVELGGAAHPAVNDYIASVPAGLVFAVSFEFRCMLNEGNYLLNAGVRGADADADTDDEITYLHRIIDAVIIRVLPMNQSVATGTVVFDVASAIRMERGVA